MFHRDGPSWLELARQALSSTERGYDLLAPKFDLTPFRTPDELLAPFFAHVFRDGPVASALDVACGTGAQLSHLASHVRDRLVGVDFSAGMLDEARRRVTHARLELQQADARRLSFRDEFELVTSAGAFGHFVGDDEAALLDGVWRALARRGRFVFLTTPLPTPASRWFWLAKGFNAAMHVRNALVDPPFIMFYLTFTWPAVKVTLEKVGFEVSARDALVEGAARRVVAVTATKP